MVIDGDCTERLSALCVIRQICRAMTKRNNKHEEKRREKTERQGLCVLIEVNTVTAAKETPS